MAWFHIRFNVWSFELLDNILFLWPTEEEALSGFNFRFLTNVSSQGGFFYTARHFANLM